MYKWFAGIEKKVYYHLSENENQTLSLRTSKNGLYQRGWKQQIWLDVWRKR